MGRPGPAVGDAPPAGEAGLPPRTTMSAFCPSVRQANEGRFLSDVLIPNVAEHLFRTSVSPL